MEHSQAYKDLTCFGQTHKGSIMGGLGWFSIAWGEKLAGRSCWAAWFSCDWMVSSRRLINNFGTLAVILVSKINNEKNLINQAMAPSSLKLSSKLQIPSMAFCSFVMAS